MEIFYEITTPKSFEEAVNAVQENTAANGFRVLHVHDVQATLAEKNFEHEALKIIEVCNSKFAYTALKIDINVSLLMPCRINVYIQDGKTKINTAKPSALVQMFQNPKLKTFADEVEEILTKIIDESK